MKRGKSDLKSLDVFPHQEFTQTYALKILFFFFFNKNVAVFQDSLDIGFRTPKRHPNLQMFKSHI